MPFLFKEILNSDWGSAIELSLFPLLFFFHFLYYTDTGSVFWVLLSYLASRKKLYQIAAITSFIAITFRQTNIVWMMLIMGLEIVDLLKNKNSNPNFKEFILFVINDYVLLIKKLWGFLLNGVLFGLFLIWNKGIVIGDKSNHVLDNTQLHVISQIIMLFRIEHAFLLSDNRHFSFYIWRWFFKGNLVNRLLVIPAYMMALTGLFSKMGI